MPIYASSKTGNADYELCPPGTQQLVCCDIVDHGNLKVQYGDKVRMQHKITIRWLSGEHKTKEGAPCLVQRRFTCSLHVQSALRKYLDSWRGRPFTEAEAESFDLEKLIGANGLGNVVHQQKPRGVFAEVLSVVPMVRHMAPIVVDPKYVRVKDRPPETAGAAAAATPGEPGVDQRSEYDDSDVPTPSDEDTPF